MNEVLGLTTYTAIRAALGVDDHDMKDAALTGFEVDKNLSIDLRTWFPKWSDLKSVVTPTADETAQITALQVYAKYYCATEILLSGQMAFLQRRTDGEIQSHRFKEDKLEDLRKAYKERMELAKTQVLEITTVHTPTTDEPTYTLFSRQAPGTDVITE